MDLSSKEVYRKMSEDEKALLRANQISTQMVLPQVMLCAIELDLFETMAKTPGGQFSCFDLASSLSRQNQQTPVILERILQYLTSESILTSTLVKDKHNGESKKLYGMTPVSNKYVRNADGTSHASPVFLGCDKVIWDSWFHLKDAVMDGGTPFNKAHGMGVFEYLGKDKRFNEVFYKCMHDNTTITMKMILEKYKGFEEIKNLVDVGGGLGSNLELIVSMYPHIKAVNFDLPHVIKYASSFPGVDHVGGDMFESVPKGDVMFMKWILHNWGDNDCINLLKNCWAALPMCGKVVVVEAVIPDFENDTSYPNETSETIFTYDMLMLNFNPGGKERTTKEYNALAKEAGFTSFQTVCRTSTFWIMEFYKNS